jgi:hypothetical protein
VTDKDDDARPGLESDHGGRAAALFDFFLARRPKNREKTE